MCKGIQKPGSGMNFQDDFRQIDLWEQRGDSLFKRGQAVRFFELVEIADGQCLLSVRLLKPDRRIRVQISGSALIGSL